MKKPCVSSNTMNTAVTTVEIRSPDAANASNDLIDMQAIQLQPSPMHSQRVVINLNKATVVFHSSDQRLRTQTSIRKNLLAYVVFGRQATGTVAGLLVRPGLMLAVAPDTVVEFVVDAGWQSVSLLISPEDVDANGNVWLRHPQGIEMLEAEPELIYQLFDWGQSLASAAVRQPDLFNESSEQLSIANAELTRLLAAVLSVATTHRPTRSDLKRRTQQHIVRIAEDLAMSRIGSDCYVKDMCEAAEVSERTLEYAFKAVIGMTPIAFLIRLRLHRARAALLSSAPESTTVTAIALRWGFGHLGEFAQAYKDCFGELPSETLMQQPTEILNSV